MSYKADRIPPLREWKPEFVSKNFGMYTGGNSLWAVTNILYTLAEFMLDSADSSTTRIAVTLTEHGSVILEDDGLPVYAREPFDPLMFEQAHASFAAGWRDGWLVVVNAVSSHLTSDVYTGAHHYRQVFARGVPQGPLECIGVTWRVGRRIEYTLDEGLGFQRPTPITPHLIQRLRVITALAPGLTTTLVDEVGDERRRFSYPDGLASHLAQEIALRAPEQQYFQRLDELLHLRGSVDSVQVDVAVGWIAHEPLVLSFANRHRTIEHGTHIDGFWRGLTKGLRRYLRDAPGIYTSSVPLRAKDLRSHIAASVAVSLDRPEFRGPFKTLLTSPEAGSAVERVLIDQLPVMMHNLGEERTSRLNLFISERFATFRTDNLSIDTLRWLWQGSRRDEPSPNTDTE